MLKQINETHRPVLKEDDSSRNYGIKENFNETHPSKQSSR